MADKERLQETLDDIYRSIFVAGSAPRELPNREAKSYLLTEAAFRQHKERIIKTIGAMANSGFDVAYIAFRGTPTTEPQIDPAKLDDAIRAVLHPAVRVEIEVRRSMDGFDVDFLRVPGSQNRPHLMRTTSNEITIPLRGAANNTTAARQELDEMYRERTVDMIRRALAPTKAIGEQDEDQILRRLQDIDWGNASSSKDPEFVIAIVPTRTDGAKPLKALIEAPGRHAMVDQAISEAIKVEPSDWLGSNPIEIVSGLREDYLEVWVPAREGHRIGTILLYESGIVVIRIWVLEPHIMEKNVYSFNHFKSALRGSLVFASKLYKWATVPVGVVDVRCLVVNAQDLDLWMTPSAPMVIRPNKDVGRVLYLPKRPIQVGSGALDAEAENLAERFGRSLLTHYGT